MFRRILASLALAAACAQAQLTITDPSPSLWWVAGAANNLAWSCPSPCPYASFTVVLSNSDKTILAAPLALIATVPSYDTSLAVTSQQSSQPVSTTYTLSLTNIQNISDIYASSQFAIQAAGSPYPTSSSSAASGATGTGSAGSPSSTGSSKTGAGVVNYVPVGMGMAAAMVLGLVVA